MRGFNHGRQIYPKFGIHRWGQDLLPFISSEDRVRETPAERLEGLDVAERLEGLDVAERLEGLDATERLEGLSLEDRIGDLSDGDRQALRQLLEEQDTDI